MKKVFVIFNLFVLSLVLIGCKTKTDESVIKVGYASSFTDPVLEILESIQEEIKADGFKLELVKINGYPTLNLELHNKNLDANFIQHQYFMEQFNLANNAKLVTAQRMYYPLFGLYANTDKYRDLDAVKKAIEDGEKVTIGVPNDSSNLSRTFYLLKMAGLIETKNDINTHITKDDVIHPNNLSFDEVQQDLLPQKYYDTGIAVLYPKDKKSNVINLETLNEIFTEEFDEIQKTYSINLVSREDNLNSNKIKSLIKAITSDKVRAIIDKYEGGVPAF